MHVVVCFLLFAVFFLWEKRRPAPPVTIHRCIDIPVQQSCENGNVPMVAADFVWNLHVLIDAHSGLSELGGLPYIELEKEYHARFGHTFNPYRFFGF